MQLFLLLDVPDSSSCAIIISVLINVVIAISTMAFILESVTTINPPSSLWDIIEEITSIIFTIEYVLRILASTSLEHNIFKFMISPLNLLDLIAILPFYLELMLDNVGVAGLKVLRVVRLTRIFRVFKVSRYSIGIKVMVETIKRSINALYLLIFFVMIGAILFSSAMYFIESDTVIYNAYNEPTMPFSCNYVYSWLW
jgi:hypothetical protein